MGAVSYTRLALAMVMSRTVDGIGILGHVWKLSVCGSCAPVSGMDSCVLSESTDTLILVPSFTIYRVSSLDHWLPYAEASNFITCRAH